MRGSVPQAGGTLRAGHQADLTETLVLIGAGRSEIQRDQRQGAEALQLSIHSSLDALAFFVLHLAPSPDNEQTFTSS